LNSRKKIIWIWAIGYRLQKVTIGKQMSRVRAQLGVTLARTSTNTYMMRVTSVLLA